VHLHQAERTAACPVADCIGLAPAFASHDCGQGVEFFGGPAQGVGERYERFTTRGGSCGGGCCFGGCNGLWSAVLGCRRGGCDAFIHRWGYLVGVG
jgi:hypothetical protein